METAKQTIFSFGTVTCGRCGRPLKNERSVLIGYGPTCRKLLNMTKEHTNSDRCDLKWDSKSMNIRCFREENGRLHFNINQKVIHHSPTGFEWGYGGSGPADFALNIMHLFIPKDRFGKENLFKGKCSYTAWKLHQDFKWDFIARMPKEGTTIKGKDIKVWIKKKTGE